MRFISFLIFITINLHFVNSTSAQKQWTLEACIQYAHQNNLQVQQVEYSGRVNEIYLSQSKAMRLPSLSANVNAGYNWGRTFDAISLSQREGGFYNGNGSLNLSMPIYKGGSLQNSIRQNRLLVESGNQDVAASKENLSITIAQNYLQILQLEEQVNNYNNQITSSQKQLENTKELFGKGIVAEHFVLQQEAQLASEEWQKQQIENSLNIAKITLMQLMEMPVTNDFVIEKPNQDFGKSILPTSSTDQIFQTSLKVRPDVRSAELTTESSVLGVRVAQGQRLPALSFVAGLSSNYSSASRQVEYLTSTQDVAIGYLANDPTQQVLGASEVRTPIIQDYEFADQLDDNLSPSVGLSLSIPIFSNKSFETKIEVAKANSEMAQLNERSVKNQLRKNIELAYADFVNSFQEFQSSEKQLELAQKVFKNADYQYVNGLLSPTDFLIQKNSLANSENNFVQAKFQYIFSKMILDFYNGEQLKL